MRITAEQKEQNREALLRSSVRIIGKEGFENATLRSICKGAGLSDPVIYSYFPTKQSLLYGYLEWSIDETLDRLAKMPSLENMPFARQVELLMQTHLDVLSEDIDYVRAIYPLVFITGLSMTQEALKPCRTIFSSFVQECIAKAVRAREFEEPPMMGLVTSLFWDFHAGVIYYWLNDKSEMKIATSELIHRSLEVISETLKSQLITRVIDLSYFLIRTHLLAPTRPDAPTPPKVLSLFHKGKKVKQ